MPRIRVGDYEINYVDEGTGFPVVLIHGLAGDLTAWSAQINELKSTYRVLAFDNRGAGKSTQIDQAVSTEDLAEDTFQLTQLLGIEKAHFVGRSMGGAVAQHIALNHPEVVRSLVLCASFARLDPLGRRVLTNMKEALEWRRSWKDHARHSVQNFVGASFYNAHPERVEQIEALIGGEQRLPACYIAQNIACLQHDTLDVLHEIRTPTLVMSGEVDPICSDTCTQWLIDRLPNCESIKFECASHFFLIEQPDRFSVELLRWLEKHTPNTPDAVPRPL